MRRTACACSGLLNSKSHVLLTLVLCLALCLSTAVGTHPGFLRALDDLDSAAQEHVLTVRRLKEERLWNVEVMFVAEMQAVDDEYKEQAEELREKMMEELMAKCKEAAGAGKSDVVTRGKRKMITKDEKPKKKQNST
jgi:hypothetical protein